MKAEELKILSVYNFNTVAPYQLGATRQNVLLEAILNYSMATKYDNVDLKARSIEPFLPEGSVKDPKAYTYLYFKNPNDTHEIMAFEWIDSSSIVETQSVEINVKIPIADATDVERIRDTLTLMGFQSIEITASLPSN